MLNKSNNDYANIAFENIFFYKLHKIFRENIVEKVWGIIRYATKFEFQQRGAPHLHEICWDQNGADFHKIYNENISDGVKEQELYKIHKLNNRYVTNLNFTTKQIDDDMDDDRDDD